MLSLAVALIAIPALCRTTRATGIESSLRWIQQSEEPHALQAPEFFSNTKSNVSPARLHPKRSAPAAQDDESTDTDRETSACDLRDFREALEKKKIAPPDAVAAEAAPLAMRELIDSPEKQHATPSLRR